MTLLCLLSIPPPSLGCIPADVKVDRAASNKPRTWGVVSSCAQLVQLARFTAALRGSSASPVDPGCPKHEVKTSLHFQLQRDSTSWPYSALCDGAAPGRSLRLLPHQPDLPQLWHILTHPHPALLPPIHPQTPHTHPDSWGSAHPTHSSPVSPASA